MLRKFAVSMLLPEVGFRELSRIEKAAHRHTFHYEPRAGYLYVRSRAISSRTNDNFDTFPAPELKKAWATFIGKPVFVNHHNDDHTRMRGVIIDAALHEDKSPDGEDDTWIEVLMEVDAINFPKLASAVIRRDIERTSMGCDVVESECSVCANVARTPDQYCAHVARMKGQRVRRKNEKTGEMEDVLVHEICRGLSFFENSLLVEDPADPTAFTYGVDTRGLVAGRTAGKGRYKSVELEDYQKDRFQGVTVKKDSGGYFVTTQRARSKSYKTIDDIPDAAISFIESTGKKATMTTDLPEAATRMHTNTSESYEETACPSCDSPYFSYVDGKYTCGDCGQQYVSKTSSKTVTAKGIRANVITASKLAAEDKRVPNQVETLRMHECPVCGSDGRWNSDGRCAVCGYLPAPKPFQEPNTDVSGRVDRDGGWFDPDLTEATPFEAPDPDPPKIASFSPVKVASPTTKGQKVEMSQGDTLMAKQNPQSVAMAARRRTAATATGSAERLVQENARLRERIAQLTKRADEENPAQPVPESAPSPAALENDDVATTADDIDAQTVDLTTPGGVIDAPAPDATDAPDAVGGSLEDEILAGSNTTDDVEAPVAGTTQVDPAAVIDVQPDNSGETIGDNAFAGDWLNEGASTVPDISGNAAGGSSTEASRRERAIVGRQVNAARDRIWASIRLARLQLQTGLAPSNSDELDLARRIEASTDSTEIITREASTIARMAAKAPRQQPQGRQAARRAPSLASDRPAVTGGIAVRGDDEALFE